MLPVGIEGVNVEVILEPVEEALNALCASLVRESLSGAVLTRELTVISGLKVGEIRYGLLIVNLCLIIFVGYGVLLTLIAVIVVRRSLFINWSREVRVLVIVGIAVHIPLVGIERGLDEMASLPRVAV